MSKTSRRCQEFSHFTIFLVTLMLAFIAGPGSAHQRELDPAGVADASLLAELMNALSTLHVEIRELAFTAEGEWALVTDGFYQSVFFSSGLPTDARSVIESYAPLGIDAIAFDPDGEFAVLAGTTVHLSSGVPNRDLLQTKIAAGRVYNDNRISELAFTADGRGWVVSAGPYVWYYRCPAGFIDGVEDTMKADRDVTGVAFGADDSWVLVADNWFASDGISTGLSSTLQSHLRSGVGITQVAVTQSGGHAVYANDRYRNKTVMDKVEIKLDGDTIYERMYDANIAGISIAIIENNRIEFERGYGVLEAGTDQWVRTDSPFDVASLSKFLGALTQMTLVEDGYLSLTSDATALAYMYRHSQQSDKHLYQWLFQNGVLPGGLCLFRLLSHSASLEPRSSWGTLYSSANFNTSNLLEDVYWNMSLGLPGFTFDYSGGGFLVADAMAEDITGEDFADLMQHRVFDALGMEDSTAHQPLTGSFLERASEMHDTYGVVNSRAIWPWHSAGGVYASAADYARAMIVLMRDGLDENGDRLLSRSSVNSMLTDFAPGSTQYGLGVYLDGDRFFHWGAHEDRARAHMKADLSEDFGIVVLVNGYGDAVDELINDIVDRAFDKF